MFTIDELYKAYLDCRKRKRNKKSSLEFEYNYEIELVKLLNEINSRTYVPSPNICFVVKKPKPREVFAANFRDRIVHHLIYNEINPTIDSYLQDNIFNCRKGKGVLFGVNTLRKDIADITNGYTKDAYFIKCDVQNFFPSIDKRILHRRLVDFLKKNYNGEHLDDVLFLIDKVIWQDVTKDCIFHSCKEEWELIPYEKSLFNTDEYHGLAIGNLTSQLFANFYMMEFDNFVKNKFSYYGRYVDDFYVLTTNKNDIRNIEFLRMFLYKNCSLILHPKKIYFQHTSKGCEFLGYHIKYERLHCSNRVMYNIMSKNNDIKIESINSYLGYLHNCTDKKKQIRIVNSLYDKVIGENIFVINNNDNIHLRNVVEIKNPTLDNVLSIYK